MKTDIIASVDQLHECADRWDDLWQRSDVALPLVRAEHLARWLETFRPGARFRAIVVEDEGRWIAALPLVERRLLGALRVGSLPCNPWSVNGDLLLDPACDREAAMQQLLAAVGQLPWPLLWLDATSYDQPAWQALLQTADQVGTPYHVHEQASVGLVRLEGTWDAYAAQLSRDFRKKLRRRQRQLEEQGEVTLRTIDCFAPGELEAAVRQAFEIEDRSWKGAAGSSVLRSPGMLEFYLQQAAAAARRGEFMLTFLEAAGVPIGFQYGYRAKGVSFAHKVSFDEAYARFGPGHLLKWLQLPPLFERPENRWFDYFGPVTAATASWADDRRRTGRVVLTAGLAGRLLLSGYVGLAPRYRALRKRWRGAPMAKNGAGAAEKPAVVGDRDGAPELAAVSP